MIPTAGQRVRLTGIMPGEAEFDPIPVGATGLVEREPTNGQIWVKWDPPHEHRTLMLLASDPFEVVEDIEEVAPCGCVAYRDGTGDPCPAHHPDGREA